MTNPTPVERAPRPDLGDVLARADRLRRRRRATLSATGACLVAVSAAAVAVASLSLLPTSGRTVITTGPQPASSARGSAPPPPVTRAPITKAELIRNQEALDVAAAQVRRLVATPTFGAVFTGLAVRPDTRTLVLYRVPDAGFDAEVTRVVGGAVVLEFLDTSRSLAQATDDLARVRAVVFGDASVARTVESTGLAQDGTVVVGTLDDGRVARRATEQLGISLRIVPWQRPVTPWRKP
jgi:hypothetical protein